MLLFLCKLFESQKLGFYKTQGWEKKTGFFRARVCVSMCAPTHIRTHRHTAVPAHPILNWLNTPRQAQGVSQFNFELSSYKQPQPHGGFKEIPCFNLTPKGCLILASGYDALLRERIIDRLETLEKSAKAQLPSTYLDALKALVASEEEKQMLAADNAKKQQVIEMKDAHLLIERQP